MRQCYLELRMYANTYRDQVPLEIFANDKGKTFYVYVTDTLSDNAALNEPAGASGYLANLGLLFRAGNMKSPKIWYCPAETDPSFSFNVRTSPANQWPPARWGEPGSPPTGTSFSNQSTSAGYAMRPEQNLSANTAPVKPMPHLSRYGTKAIMTEILYRTTSVQSRHQNGVNVIMGDGSGKWVPLSVFKTNWTIYLAFDAAGNPNAANPYMLSPTPYGGTWVDLERF